MSEERSGRTDGEGHECARAELAGAATDLKNTWSALVEVQEQCAEQEKQIEDLEEENEDLAQSTESAACDHDRHVARGRFDAALARLFDVEAEFADTREPISRMQRDHNDEVVLLRKQLATVQDDADTADRDAAETAAIMATVRLERRQLVRHGQSPYRPSQNDKSSRGGNVFAQQRTKFQHAIDALADVKGKGNVNRLEEAVAAAVALHKSATRLIMTGKTSGDALPDMEAALATADKLLQRVAVSRPQSYNVDTVAHSVASPIDAAALLYYAAATDTKDKIPATRARAILA